MIKKKNCPIAFFDSGVGGISVLNEAIKMMPNENYIYFGDSKNAPYGIKSSVEVRKLTEQNVKYLLGLGAKAVVIACNTATSAGAEILRSKLKKVPIIGVEPALKPAALNHQGEKVLVMATSMTLAEKKFKALMSQYEEYADIVPVPCPGLMEFVENGKVEGEELEQFLRILLPDAICKNATAVVLGCTHYPFIQETITTVLGGNISIYDGGYGTAKQLQRRLEREGLLTDNKEHGQMTVLNSLGEGEVLELSKLLIEKGRIRDGTD